MKKTLRILLLCMVVLTLGLPVLAEGETYTCSCGEAIDASEGLLVGEVCPSCGSEIYLYEDGSSEIYQYNEHGHQICAVYYDAEGNATYVLRTELEYDDQGNMTHEKIYEEETLIAEMTYALDAEGLAYVQEEIWYAQEGRSVVQYNEHGDIVLDTLYDGQGAVTFSERFEYQYDEQGQAVHQKIYQDDMLVMEVESLEDGETVTEYAQDGTKTVRRYDSRSDLIRQTEYDAEGNVTYEETLLHEYDAEGNKTSEKVYAGETLISETKYIFSDKGWCYVENETWYEEDGSKTVFEYNEYGEMTLQTDYDSEGSVLFTEQYDHVYDENGFKISETVYSNQRLAGEILYSVNDEGLNYIQRETWYLEDGTKSVVEYDEQGEALRETHYDAEGNVITESDEVSKG